MVKKILANFSCYCLISENFGQIFPAYLNFKPVKTVNVFANDIHNTNLQYIKCRRYAYTVHKPYAYFAYFIGRTAVHIILIYCLKDNNTLSLLMCIH